MAWFYLLIAGVLEIGWAVGLKYTDGFSRPLASILTLIGMAASVAFLALALKSLPMGTAYAVRTGIGAVGTVIFGIAVMGDPATLARLSCIGLIITGGTSLALSEVARIAGDVLPGLSVEFGDDPLSREYCLREIDISAAKRDLGYVPKVGLADGIVAYADRLRASR